MRHDQTSNIFQERSDAALLGDHYGSTGGDRFRRGVAKILTLGWKDKYISVPIGCPFVLRKQGARKINPGGYPKLGRRGGEPMLKSTLIGACKCQHQCILPHAFWKLREGLKQQFRAFFQRQAAQKQNNFSLLRDAEDGAKFAAERPRSGR